MRARSPSKFALLLLGVLAAAALPAGTGAAQETPDIPDPGAPEGALATAYLDRPFDRYPLPVAPLGGQAAEGPAAAPLREVEGRVIWSAYRLEDPAASVAEVMAGYRARLAELGFSAILDCATTACGGFDFRFGVSLLPAPAMLIDTADFAQLSASRAGAGGAESFVSVLVSRVLRAIQIQTVLVLPAEAGRSMTPAPPRAEAVAETLALPQDAEMLLERLNQNGHVTVQGLEFDTGGTALSEASNPALDTAARLMLDHPELKILIVGHSDNQGALEANIALSERRAKAVRAALIERGVTAERLEAKGIGFLAPVASNATPEGKALNRRVELVLR